VSKRRSAKTSHRRRGCRDGHPDFCCCHGDHRGNDLADNPDRPGFNVNGSNVNVKRGEQGEASGQGRAAAAAAEAAQVATAAAVEAAAAEAAAATEAAAAGEIDGAPFRPSTGSVCNGTY
jgi:hypothetical protein